MSNDHGAEAFERLYDEHAAALLAFLTYQTGDRDLAEDIVADTFEKVLTSASRWRGRSSEKTWLYAVALNRLRDLSRRRGAEARAIERVAALSMPPDDLTAIGDRDLLQRGLQTLPADERTVVALRFGADLSLREIAKLLHERQTTIEGRLYRGLRRLRDAAT